ncbi:MAG: hypothetical protein ACTH4K_08760 [Serratia bockelmannii]
MPVAGADTSPTIAPLIAHGLGSVIAPEGSKYTKEKNAAMTKQILQQTKRVKPNDRKNYHDKKKHQKKK